MDGQTDRRTDGWTDGHENEQGRTDGPSHSDGLTPIDDSMELHVQFYFLPPRDAVDNRFQRTHDVLTGIKTE